MSDQVRAEAERLVDTLEAQWLDPQTADDEAVEALLVRRQELLDQLQSLDATAIDADTQTRLRTRMQALRERDQQLLASLQSRLESTANQLGNAAQGRAAVRGYRAPEDAEAKILIRPV